MHLLQPRNGHQPCKVFNWSQLHTHFLAPLCSSLSLKHWFVPASRPPCTDFCAKVRSPLLSQPLIQSPPHQITRDDTTSQPRPTFFSECAYSWLPRPLSYRNIDPGREKEREKKKPSDELYGPKVTNLILTAFWRYTIRGERDPESQFMLLWASRARTTDERGFLTADFGSYWFWS